jgi:hypothetical protein
VRARVAACADVAATSHHGVARPQQPLPQRLVGCCAHNAVPVRALCVCVCVCVCACVCVRLCAPHQSCARGRVA